MRFAIACLAASACGRVSFDARQLDAGADVAAPLGAFAPPIRLDIPVGQQMQNPSLTADELELYFASNDDLYVSARATPASPWSSPSVVTELNSGSTETDPEINSDGLTLYFASNRAGTHDIYVTARVARGDLWGTPVAVMELSSSGEDYAPAADASGLRLVMAAAIASNEDIYYSSRASPIAAWIPPQIVPAVNSSEVESTPCLAGSGTDLIFASARLGSSDLFEATRASELDAFGVPVPIAELNTMAQEGGPWLSEDRRHLVFESDVSGAYELYETWR